MADEESTNNAVRDREILVGMLGYAHKFLFVLVFERKELLMKGTANVLRMGWEDAEASLVRASAQLREIDWRYVEGAGLTGRQLEMKDRLLRMDVGTGIVGRIIRRLDSIMGSLASVLPVLEIAREYKEQVEISIEDLNSQV